MDWPWRVIEDGSGTWWVFGILSGILAFLTAVYTGLLLGASPIPFWNTPILPVLFLVSCVSTGIAAIVLTTVHILGLNIYPEIAFFLLQTDGFIIVLEMILLALYLYGMNLETAAKTSVSTIIRGRLAGSFWIGLVGFGLLVPLISEWAGSWTLLPTVCTLAGGYLLRSIVVSAGVKIPLSAQGMIIPIPGRN